MVLRRRTTRHAWRRGREGHNGTRLPASREQLSGVGRLVSCRVCRAESPLFGATSCCCYSSCMPVYISLIFRVPSVSVTVVTRTYPVPHSHARSAIIKYYYTNYKLVTGRVQFQSSGRTFVSWLRRRGKAPLARPCCQAHNVPTPKYIIIYNKMAIGHR